MFNEIRELYKLPAPREGDENVLTLPLGSGKLGVGVSLAWSEEGGWLPAVAIMPRPEDNVIPAGPLPGALMLSFASPRDAHALVGAILASLVQDVQAEPPEEAANDEEEDGAS